MWGHLLKRRPQDPLPYQELGRAREALMAKVHQVACRLLDTAAAQEMPAYLEETLTRLEEWRSPATPPCRREDILRPLLF